MKSVWFEIWVRENNLTKNLFGNSMNGWYHVVFQKHRVDNKIKIIHLNGVKYNGLVSGYDLMLDKLFTRDGEFISDKVILVEKEKYEISSVTKCYRYSDSKRRLL